MRIQSDRGIGFLLPSGMPVSARLFGIDAAPVVRRAIAVLVAGVVLLTAAAPVSAAEPQWIWAPTRTTPAKPAGNCYFRKTFDATGATGGKIEMTCDENYILYINGLKIGSGDNWRSLDSYDLGPYLTAGDNVVAVAALKSQPGPAGLAARLTIERDDGQSETLFSGPTWRISPENHAGWTQPAYNDSLWAAARSLGPLGLTEPWGNQVAAGKERPQARFQVTREFRVEWVVPAKSTGSLLAMTFNEFGNILISRENGPLLLVRDTNADGLPDAVSTYCDKVKNCQGILALNGDVFVTADGPDGAALYRLIDRDRDGKSDELKPLIKFSGHMEEHGPHAVALGPDGMIYVLAGNLSKLATKPRADSPYARPYEGDLVQPRYEDPKGFALGVKAPGGMILRTDVNGATVETFAGGLRNPYDIAFHPQGELLTHDADMESDEGLPWYRPTRVCHIVPGAEFGWRSGWAKWPDYFVDNLPAVIDTGPGSPTGLAVYDHHMYPLRYHGTMFVGDWSQGQILAVSLTPNGSTYSARSSVFVEGNPLNITDLEIGPDGWLYFCTGGRGTEGGVYRVVWMGKVPPEVAQLGTGINAALKQPQFNSAFARQQIAAVKKRMGTAWDRDLARAVVNRSLSTQVRTRALDIMQLFGPFPTPELLVELSRDRDSQVRAKAAALMGLHAGEKTNARLVEMLNDPSALVERVACESLARAGAKPPAARLLPLLASRDRHVAFAARTVLRRLPRDAWRESVLTAREPRVFLIGSIGLLSDDPDQETCRRVLDHCQEMMKGFVSDEDFIDLLRVCELAMIHGKFPPEQLTATSRLMAAEYPAGEPRINRELVRILAHLESPYVAERYLQQLRGNQDLSERMHLAMHAARFVEGWKSPQRLSILETFEEIRKSQRGATYGRYLDRVTRDFTGKMTDDERKSVIAQGTKWPGAALGALAQLPKDLDDKTIANLRRLDSELVKDKSEAADRLRIGIVAILARSGNSEAMAYLRDAFDKEPERRPVLAMGLAQQPAGDNWPLLVRSLGVVQGAIAVEVLAKLAEVEQTPDKPEPIRQVILHHLKAADDATRKSALELLKRWTAGAEGRPADADAANIEAWQKWYATKYPEEPAAELPKSGTEDKYTLEELEKYLAGSEASAADRHRGAAVFARARCAACHRFGSQGESLGPDLTTVARRFQRREILESILYPSHVISDQYATKTVHTTDGRSLSGVVAIESDGSVTVLSSTGEKTRVPKGEIEEIVASKNSSMPPGLLNTLSLAEIADLFAYLQSPPAPNLTRKPDDKKSSRQ